MTPLNRALVKAYQKTTAAAGEPEVRTPVIVRAPLEPSRANPVIPAHARSGEALSEPAANPISPLIVRREVVETSSSSSPEFVRGWVAGVRPPIQRQTQIASWNWPDICEEILRVARPGFEAIADSFLSDLEARGLQSIAFAGAEPDSGTTSAMLTIAHVLAARRLPVLLIDADFERPGLLEAFSMSKRLGLWEAVMSATSIDVALQPLVGTSLTLLPLIQPVPDHDVGLAQIVILESLIANLRNRFSLLLIDMGPSLPSRTLALGRAGILDALIEVCRADSAAEFHSENGSLCESAAVEFLGRIETFTKGSST